MIRALRRNFGYKVFSLLLSSLLFYIAGAQTDPRAKSDNYIQPEIVRLPDVLVVREAPVPVLVQVAGPESALSRLDKQPIKATIDGAAAKPGVNHLPIRLTLPPGVVAVNRPLPFAQFSTERKEQQKYSVDVDFAGTAPAGQEYGDRTVTPSAVVVEGLPEDLKHVARVVASVEREPNELAVERPVTMYAEDDQKRRVEGVTMIPAQVTVRVPLRPVPTTKTMLLSAKLTGKPAPGFRVVTYEISPQSVVVRGAVEAISSRSSLAVPVDVGGVSKTGVRSAALSLPAGLSPQEPLPPIKVRLVVEPIPGVDGAKNLRPSPVPSVAASPGAPVMPNSPAVSPAVPVVVPSASPGGSGQ